MIVIPLRTYSSLNERVHHMVRAKRARMQRESVGWSLQAYEPPALPCVVTMNRIAQRSLDEDNLAAALKHVQDAIAAWMGIDDADRRIKWLRGQEKTARGHWFVRIEVSPSDTQGRSPDAQAESSKSSESAIAVALLGGRT